MTRRWVGLSGLAVVLAAGACSTGSGHPSRDAGVGTGGKGSVDSGTGGSVGTDASTSPPACGVYETGTSNTYKTATLHGQAWKNVNSESSLDIYTDASGAQICGRGTVVDSATDFGWAILMFDVNTVLQPVGLEGADAGADAGTGTAISAWNSFIPQTSGLRVDVTKKSQTPLWVCLQGANYHQWCVKKWTNNAFIAWTEFTDQNDSSAKYAMQPLMTIQLTVPGGTGAFDFCVNNIVELAGWCACPGGLCTCPPGNNACNGTCVPDTSVNPLNCGACGKVCPNASACYDGDCRAPIYDGLGAPTNVYIDGSDLYYTEAGSGTVMKGTSSGGAQESVASGQNTPIRVVASNAQVYWANAGTQAQNFTDGTIMKLAGGVQTQIVKDQINITALAIDSKFIYWANAGTRENSTFNGSITKADLTSGAVTPLSTGRAHPRAIAVDPKNIYWVEQGSGNWGNPVADGKVMKLALDAAPAQPQPLASSLLAPAAIAVDINNLYYATVDSIFKISLSDGTSTKLATEQSQPYTLAVDSTDVYWANLFSGTVTSVPIAGGTVPVILAKGQTFAVGLALDSTNVYCAMQTDSGLGAISKMPK